MATQARLVTSPVGTLRITAENGAITRVDWASGTANDDDSDPLLARAVDQLAEYFAGTRTAFDLPLAPRGTIHDQTVWREMQSIPYGATCSYSQIARVINSSARAVGTACGRNPIPVIIPCHRVLAANGGIGGYSGAGGTDTKRRLLALEGAMLAV